MSETNEMTGATGVDQMVETQIIVGCGGLLYHAMSGMACEAKMRRGTEYMPASRDVFIDGDVIEQRNMERQA